MRLANPMMMLRTALFVLLAAMIATGQAPQTYQHGTITGWSMRYYPSGLSGKHRFYELKGTGMIYQIDDCGSFQAGQFSTGQAVDYRVDESDKSDKRIYIKRDNGKEYKCRMDGAKAIEGAQPDAPSTPAPSPKP